MGKKKKKAKKGPPRSPADTVKKLMKAGKVKKKCCRSTSRCKKCPVLALRKAKAQFAKAA
ncbi:hypothetical protein [Labedaea rhizosphaerae]|uniref:Uncharacterized protein n=1 Tax=Labedaea rhizosphaerae TaxID=598644 RepID=A0A4R6SK02_LABRH|nr:hypothetical protein [Labedaea rhizosphaerae]TDQ04154.1 hypothetical protein EV186_10195 [Labedaea rhizosphaerae]